MKKLAVICVLMLALSFVPAMANDNVTAIIPDYDVIIDSSSIYFKDSLYPFLSYNNVTYFPLTYDYARSLNLSISWENGSLYIAFNKNPYCADGLPIYETFRNSKSVIAKPSKFPIFINGKRFDNSASEYPFLSFRDVTYLPITYDLAHGEFLWNTDFSENVFTLSTDLYYTSIELSENGEDSAVFTLWDNNGEGSFSADSSVLKTKRLSYLTDEITDIEAVPSQDLNETRHEVEINNGHIIYYGNTLAEIKALASGATEESDTDAWGCEYQYGGVSYLEITVLYNLDIPAPYTPKEIYTYVCMNGNYILAAEDTYISKAAFCGGYVYLSGQKRTGFRGMLYPAFDLIRISADGTVIRVNDKYPDYNSMRLIGAANGKLYVKCMWCPENSADENFSVSAYNDGYFALDELGLTRLTHYIYSDDDFVSPNGKIYAIDNYSASVKRVY